MCQLSFECQLAARQCTVNTLSLIPLLLKHTLQTIYRTQSSCRQPGLLRKATGLPAWLRRRLPRCQGLGLLLVVHWLGLGSVSAASCAALAEGSGVPFKATAEKFGGCGPFCVAECWCIDDHNIKVLYDKTLNECACACQLNEECDWRTKERAGSGYNCALQNKRSSNPDFAHNKRCIKAGWTYYETLPEPTTIPSATTYYSEEADSGNVQPEKTDCEKTVSGNLGAGIGGAAGGGVVLLGSIAAAVMCMRKNKPA